MGNPEEMNRISFVIFVLLFLVIRLHAQPVSPKELVDQFEAAADKFDKPAAQKALESLFAYPDELPPLQQKVETLWGPYGENPGNFNVLLDFYTHVLKSPEADRRKFLTAKILVLFAMGRSGDGERLQSLEELWGEFPEQTSPLLLKWLVELKMQAPEEDINEKSLFYVKMLEYIRGRGLRNLSEDEALAGVEDKLIEEFQIGSPDCSEIERLFKPEVDAQTLSKAHAVSMLALLSIKNCDNAPLFEAAETVLMAENVPPFWQKLVADGRLNKGNVSSYLLRMEQVIANTENPQMRAGYFVEISQIHQMMREYRNAKKDLDSARKAYPEWGMPHLMTALLLLEGANTCDFDAFEQKAVHWAAIDFCQQAKNSDPTVGPMADQLIFELKNEMPTAREIEFRGYSPGDTFPLRCWMNIVTTVKLP